jgi:hypothetical protein
MSPTKTENSLSVSMTLNPTALALLLQKEHTDFLEEQNTSSQKMHCTQNKVLREMQKVAEGSPGKMEFLSTNLWDLQRKLITEYPMKNTKEAANKKGGYNLGTAAFDKSITSKGPSFNMSISPLGKRRVTLVVKDNRVM